MSKPHNSNAHMSLAAVEYMFQDEHSELSPSPNSCCPGVAALRKSRYQGLVFIFSLQKQHVSLSCPKVYLLRFSPTIGMTTIWFHLYKSLAVVAFPCVDFVADFGIATYVSLT
uniref:Uncharacterized protein n=1 Tax=Solanum lycopersicum TaxID=4081 RepID=A0A3Q7JVT5_SOLLC